MSGPDHRSVYLFFFCFFSPTLCACVRACVQVCRKALQLLAQVEHEPLLNLEQLNPELLQHAEPMAQAHSLRQRLRLLGDYLLTCRSEACKKLQARWVCVFSMLPPFYQTAVWLTPSSPGRMEQRTYPLETSHLYSVVDLRQVRECAGCVDAPVICRFKALSRSYVFLFPR